MAEAMVRFHRLAAAEYKSALAWYRVRSQKAASEFRDELGRVMQRLRTVPKPGTVFRGEYRWIRLRRFPYVLYFKIVSPDVITIYALAHARRRLDIGSGEDSQLPAVESSVPIYLFTALYK